VRHLSAAARRTDRGGEDIILGHHYVAVTPQVYGERTADLAGLGFVHDEKEDRFLAPATPNCGTY